MSTKARPTSILDALTKIGGLLGILKVFSLVTRYQQMLFENELVKKDGDIISPLMTITPDVPDSLNKT
jgi:hypothetical protein